MRAVISYLRKFFDNERYEEVVHWVNAQYARQIDVQGQSITLADVNEYYVLSEVQDICEALKPTVDELTNGVYLLPRLNASMSDFEVVSTVGGIFFISKFAQAGIEVETCAFAFQDDIVEYRGSNKPISISWSGKQDGEPVCLAVNYKAKDNSLVGSALVTKEEIAGCQNAAIDKLMSGTDALTHVDWENLVAALAFKRLFSDGSLVSLSKQFSRATLNHMALIAQYYERHYSDNAQYDNNNVVYNDFGRRIGVKTVRFNAIDKKKHNTLHTNVAVIPSANTKPKENSNNVVPVSFEQRANPSGFGNL